jgi:membrane protein DedA with SNARE-associated domain
VTVVLLALIHVPSHLGYLALGLLVGVEASGVPVPGETALITASILASQGKLSIEAVIAVAAAAAIIGDNVGYLLGTKLGRQVLERPGPIRTHRLAILRRGDALFDRHGSKAVFFGRWIAGLRIWAAWLAGISTMRWRSFLLWNALGGIAWAIWFGLLGYFGGEAAARLAARVGVGAAAAAAAALALVYLAVRLRRRRAARNAERA